MREQAKLRVLIVDDDPSARDTLEALLTSEDYELGFARDGREALNTVAEFAPDTVLLDVMMPDIDGFEICRRLKEDSRWRHIPVVLVTALDSKEDLVRGLNAGADEFLSKPVNGPELRARVRSMLRIKGQYDELVEALQLREDLTNMIVHDMRDPLTSIIALSDFIQQAEVPFSIRADLQDIHTAALRLSSFLNDMLMLAKMQAGKLLLTRTIVDVNKVVLAAQKSHDVVARSRGIDLVVELPDKTQQIMADASLLLRVLDNLISNALRFSPSNTRVILRVEYPMSQSGAEASRFATRIQVIDQGPGIDAEYRDRIFEKFEVMELRKRHVPQVGLGLAFCKMVVQAHGGQIYVTSNQPKGAVFTVEI